MTRLGRLRPHPEMVALGYFVVRKGQVMVTPLGLRFIAQCYEPDHPLAAGPKLPRPSFMTDPLTDGGDRPVSH